MAFTLSRIDRKSRTYDLSAATLEAAAAVPPGVLGVDVALLSPRSAPTAATVWTAASYDDGTFTVLLAGPDADSTGALVVPASADLWMKVADNPEVDAELVERISVLGGGAALAPVTPSAVVSVNGKTGAAVVLDADDVGALAPGDGAGGALSGTYPNPGLNGSAVESIVVASDAVRAAYGRGLFTPESMGAAATYSAGVDDTTFVQAAINAAVAAGGGVWLSRNYRVPAGGLVASGPLTMVGIGGRLDINDHALSALVVNSATATALTLNGQGNTLRDFAVLNVSTTTPTAGVGIKAENINGNQGSLERLTVSNFYDNVKVGGVYWTIDDCRLYDAVHYSLWMTSALPNYYDHGDMGITNNVITALRKPGRLAEAAVRWEAGGGIRFIGNKINGEGQPHPDGVSADIPVGKFKRGLDLAVGNEVVTVDLMCTGNSIEACTEAMISVKILDTAVPGFFSNVTVTGNELGFGTFDGDEAVGVDMDGHLFGHLRNIVISANVFSGLAGSIRAQNVVGVSIGPNAHEELVGPAIQLLGPQCVAVDVAQQNFRDPGVIIVNESTTRNNVVNRYSRDGFTVNSTTVYADLWEFDVPTYGSGTLEVTVAGSVSGVGSVRKVAVRDFHRDAGVVGLTTVGADRNVGASNLDIQFDGSVAGTVTVRVKLPAGSTGTELHGQVTIDVTGDVSRLELP